MESNVLDKKLRKLYPVAGIQEISRIRNRQIGIKYRHVLVNIKTNRKETKKYQAEAVMQTVNEI
jgi:hypothetical protein